MAALKAKATGRSTAVEKSTPITLDLGNYAAYDTEPVDRVAMQARYESTVVCVYACEIERECVRVWMLWMRVRESACLSLCLCVSVSVSV